MTWNAEPTHLVGANHYGFTCVAPPVRGVMQKGAVSHVSDLTRVSGVSFIESFQNRFFDMNLLAPAPRFAVGGHGLATYGVTTIGRQPSAIGHNSAVKDLIQTRML